MNEKLPSNVVPFEQPRAIVRSKQPERALNGTLSWAADDRRALEFGLDTEDTRSFTTGFNALDDATCGVVQGNVMLLAGRTGTGKSSFAMTVANTLAIANAPPVLYVSMEMNRADLAVRSTAWITGISQTRINLARFKRLRLEDWEREAITKTIEWHSRRVAVLTDCFTVAGIREHARRLQAEHGLSAIIVDHIGLTEPEPGARHPTREREVSAASRAIKVMAEELGVGVLLLAQMNRSSHQAPEPELIHLRDSGSLEQDASVVAFLWPTPDRAKDRARVYIRKNRFGFCDEFDLAWNGATGKFTGVAPEQTRLEIPKATLPPVPSFIEVDGDIEPDDTIP